MTSTDAQAVSIQLLEKEYSINCPADAEAELLASADFLNEKMQEIRQNGKVLGLERIAVMTALNLAHELLHSKQDYNNSVEQRLRHLGNKIDAVLNEENHSRNN